MPTLRLAAVGARTRQLDVIASDTGDPVDGGLTTQLLVSVPAKAQTGPFDIEIKPALVPTGRRFAVVAVGENGGRSPRTNVVVAVALLAGLMIVSETATTVTVSFDDSLIVSETADTLTLALPDADVALVDGDDDLLTLTLTTA